MQGVAVVFIAQAFGIELTTAALMTVVLTAVSASIGTAGVPGVGTIMLAMVFESVGLPAEGVAMIMGVDRLLDMGRTAINITGDAMVTMCMAKLSGLLDISVFKDHDYATVSLNDISQPEEPTGYSDFTAEGEPNEIGENGEPDKYSKSEV